MARLAKNSLLTGLTGHIGKQLVIKHYGDKTVVTAYPSMPNKKKISALQALKRNRFKDAVAYAQNIRRDIKLNAAYQKKVKPGESVYHYAIKEYLNKHTDNSGQALR